MITYLASLAAVVALSAAATWAYMTSAHCTPHWGKEYNSKPAWIAYRTYRWLLLLATVAAVAHTVWAVASYESADIWSLLAPLPGHVLVGMHAFCLVHSFFLSEN